MTSRCLVVENDPTSDLGHFAEWLNDGGLELQVVRPHTGEQLPEDLTGYAALVVLGGHQSVASKENWFRPLEGLLRLAVQSSVPTLGLCLGAQLLAAAHLGTVEPAEAGPEIGPGLVAKRDAAEGDPLFGPMPMLPDVIQWHFDEITELPIGAVLLATSVRSPVQAFRLGAAAWGTQFHPENDVRSFVRWVADNGPVLAELGLDGERLVAQVQALQDDLFEVWHPFATRFAALARGELAGFGGAQTPAPGRRLPLL